MAPLTRAAEPLTPYPREEMSGDTSTTIVVCRSIEGVQALSRQPAGVRVVVASDDPRVHQFAAGLSYVASVAYLEKPESLYVVAEDVVKLLDAVNRWLANIASTSRVPAVVLEWESHAEGGARTQRIQDALLLVRSYSALLDAQQPKKIVLVRSSGARWEDELLEEIAIRRGIPVESVRCGVWSSCKLAVNRTWASVRPLAKEIVLATRVVRAKLRDPKVPPKVDEPLIAIQLCDGAAKHLNTCVPLVQALRREKLHGLVIGWGAGSSIKRLAREGYAAIALETWVSPVALVKSWYDALRIRRAAGKALPALLRDDASAPIASLLRPVLTRSMREFVVGDVPNRLRLHASSRRFFGRYVIDAARLWTRVLPQGVIAFEALSEHRLPLLFWQPGWPYNVREPYRHYTIPANLIFALSQAHRERLIADGVDAEQVVVAGLPWLERIRETARLHTKTASRAALALRPDASAYVMFDPGYVLRGYMTAAEQSQQLEAILTVARRFPDVEFMVKPHPAHTPGSLEALLAKANLGNVRLIAKHGPTYEVLNAADVLVTKMSTLAIEAVCLNVPSVCALFDRESEFRIYEDAVAYAYDSADLARQLTHILSDRKGRDSWHTMLLNKAKAYLERHGLDTTGNPNEIIAAELRRRLVG